jgi:murein DD-endopeptidase MepM/ murein hydrolase activator NlpD
MRRYTVRRARTIGLLYLPQRYLEQRVWPHWFRRWLVPPFLWAVGDRRSQRVEQAAQAARAAFEDIPYVGSVVQVPDVDVSKDTLKSRSAHPKWGRLARLPLRYAAHVVIVLLVVTITLVSGNSSWSGVLQLDGMQSATVAVAADAGDPQIRLTTALARRSDEGELTLPVVRAPQVAFQPAFVESHELVEGETLGAIAERYHVTVASLFWSNDLQDNDVLATGQELRIPRISGVPHVIRPNESLDSIAAMFSVAPAAITLFKANGISEDRALPVGREIFIPGGMLPYSSEVLARHTDEQGIAAIKVVAAGVVQEADTNLRAGPGRAYARLGYLDAGHRLRLVARHGVWVEVDGSTSGVGWVRADLIGLTDVALNALAETNDFPPPPPVWIWPTRGEITSPFGWRSSPYRSFHDGLDIANAAWTKIFAARAGRVSEAGWCSGFGYCVKIDHGDGVMTIYGHMIKKPPVRVGDVVDAGDLIGYMGSTYDSSGGGYSTGVHLHFTVKVNGQAVNPLKFLP